MAQEAGQRMGQEEKSQKMGFTNEGFVQDEQTGDKVDSPPETKLSKVLTDAEKRERSAIMKNVFVISLAFTFLFTSYNSISNLQSSINKTDGTTAQTALYAAFIFSCCFIPSWMIKRLKEKYTMALSMLCYALYMAAQFEPRIYTLVPTAMIVGLGAAPLWSAKCTYLTKVGTIYADIVGESCDVTITRFFGIFFLFFQSTQIWGNIISSTVLSVGVSGANKSDEDYELCGYHFCPWDAETNVTNSTDDGDIPSWQRYTMSSIYLVFTLLSSLVVVLFVDPLSRFEKFEQQNKLAASSGERSRSRDRSASQSSEVSGKRSVSESSEVSGKRSVSESSEVSAWVLMLRTFNHMRHPYQLLIISITIWSGLEQGFLSADFTAAYVSCGVGVHLVGFVLICYGVCDAFFSLAFTPLVKSVGRVPVFTLGAVINLGVIATLRYWAPRPDDLWVFFLLSALWGVADAVWQTQINSLYGVLFPGESEAAFSNYRLWESTGFIINYACSTLICIEPKVILLVVFLVLGISGYYGVEWMESRGGVEREESGKVLYVDQLVKRRCCT